MSKAITAAPSVVRLVIRSARRVLGHGHCPSLARLFSSISTMVTGLAVLIRGVDDLERIEDPDPKLLDRRGIGDAQRRKPDQEPKADQPRIAEPPREPAPPYPQPLHAVWISGSDNLITPDLTGFPAPAALPHAPLPRSPAARCCRDGRRSAAVDVGGAARPYRVGPAANRDR